MDAQQLAFPRAEGFGKFSSGGREDRVVSVDNLNDKGIGSFRQALEAFPTDPIIVIFKVSGIIELVTPIVIKWSNITIAGQTAPGGGICLKGHSFMLNGAKMGRGNYCSAIRSISGSQIFYGWAGWKLSAIVSL